MTGSNRPARGRRNNGLDAREFVALVDLDPRVGEHLLDVLAVAGIAAFLQPSADFNPIIRSTVLPSRPTDQLWVDREHAEDARELLAQVDSEAVGGTNPDVIADQEQRHQQGRVTERDRSDDVDTAGDPAGLDIDAAFQEIVASYDAPTDARPSTWPASEDTNTDADPDRPATGGQLARADHLRPLGPPTLGPRDHTLAEPSDDDLLDEDDTADEGYTPPPPPPLPRPSRNVVVGVLAVIVGFVLFFRPSLLPVSSNGVMVLGVLGILGGAAVLVYQLRDGLSSDDDPDDGAVV
jgi:hypothetical protein